MNRVIQNMFKSRNTRIMTPRIISLAILLASGFALMAQNEVDALRYSLSNPAGTARSVAMGGAFGALGGDQSALSDNPAGIGVYRKSEFNFTPGFYHDQVSSSYNGTTTKDDKYNFNIGNVGWVKSWVSPDKLKQNGWMNANFGITYNRTNNYNRNSLFSGTTNSTMLSQFANNANGKFASELQDVTYLAWQTYLIDSIPNTNNYYHQTPFNTTTQTNTLSSKGNTNELQFTFGANYSNKLYIGGSVSWASLRYEENRIYLENGLTDSLQRPNSFTLNQSLNSTGSGVNFKFGMIYKPTEWLRLGGAVHSPTFYSMHDSWSSSITANINNHSNISSDPSLGSGSFDYELNTPLKTIGSIALVLGKKGIISGDIEFLNYSEARLHSSSYNFMQENTAIQSIYTSTQNYKLGTEWRFDPFTLRGGYAYYGNPFSSATGINTARYSYSLGFGIRSEGYYVDFAWVLTKYSEKYYPYDPTLVDAATLANNTQQFIITVGHRW